MSLSLFSLSLGHEVRLQYCKVAGMFSFGFFNAGIHPWLRVGGSDAKFGMSNWHMEGAVIIRMFLISYLRYSF